MKHILLLTPGFAADEQDSRCIPPLQGLVRELGRQGKVKVSVIALHYPFRKEVYPWHNVPVHACHSSLPALPGKLLSWNRALRYFNELNRFDPVDGIHSFWFGECALLGQYLSRRHGLPHWVTLMGQDARRGNRYLHLLNASKMNCIALSSFQNKQWKLATGTEADQIIPWGLDLADLPAPEAQQRDIHLLGVGSLTPLKNYVPFLRVAAVLKDKVPGFKAVLIGKGPEEEGLKKLAGQMGLGDKLTFTGALSREETMGYMVRSRVLLHPSTYESFGYVFAEALYYGMKVVSFEVGLAEASDRWTIAQDEAGLLQGVEAQLQNPNSSPLLLHSMTDTAQRYTDLYEAH